MGTHWVSRIDGISCGQHEPQSVLILNGWPLTVLPNNPSHNNVFSIAGIPRVNGTAVAPMAHGSEYQCDDATAATTVAYMRDTCIVCGSPGRCSSLEIGRSTDSRFTRTTMSMGGLNCRAKYGE